MERLHPVHLVTLAVAVLAAVFAFVAMRVAFEARDAAWSAGSDMSVDNSYEINQLQTALIRAGLIDDPSVIPDDHQQLDGPWARCLTADEREDMGLTDDDVELPTPCETVAVDLVTECYEPAPVPESDVESDDDVADCVLWYRIDGRRFEYWDEAHPADVDRDADEWLIAESSDGVDRLARGHDSVFLHVVGEGWRTVYR